MLSRRTAASVLVLLGAVAVALGATTSATADSGWFVDSVSPADRAAEIPVPANPKSYDGKRKHTEAYFRTRYGSLAVPITQAYGHHLESGQALSLSAGSYFRFDSTSPTKKAKRQVAGLASALSTVSAVTCEGYADYAGPEDNERRVSKQRAAAICRLIRKVAPQVATTVVGYGGKRPAVVGGDSRVSRAANRRVVIVVNRATSDTTPAPAPMVSAPVDSDSTKNHVVEGAGAGTSTGLTASSTSNVGRPLTYAIGTDSSHGGFKVDPSTGRVTVADSTKVNFETATHTYSLTITATDGTTTVPSTFTVDVDDVAPSGPVDANAAANSVPENSATGTTVGVTASSTDVNGPAVTWDLADSADGRFSIDSGGVVRVADGTKLDYETATGHSYTVTVRATAGALTASQTFTIAVTNVNEAPVAADDAYSTNEGTALSRSIYFGVLVNDADPDGDMLTAELVSPPSHGSLDLDRFGGNFLYIPQDGYSGVDTFTYRAKDGALTSNLATVTITVNHVNHAPTANDDAVSAAETSGSNNATPGVDPTFNVIGGTGETGTTGKDTDPDAGDTLHVVSVTPAGTANPRPVALASGPVTGAYGALQVASDGRAAYIVDQHNATVEALNVGGSVTDSFTYDIADQAGATSGTATITITIHGANDAAVISGITTGTVTEQGGINNTSPGRTTSTGVLRSTDVDNPSSVFTASTTQSRSAGGYGFWTMDPGGVWTYSLDNTNATVQGLNDGQTLPDTFTVTATDGTPQVVTITIDGANDAAVISGTSTGTDTEAGGVNNAAPGTPTGTGTLTDTDVDNPDNTFTPVSTATASANGYGTWKMTASGTWTYTLDNTNANVEALNVGGHLDDSFTVTTVDGTQQTVSITIQGANDAAVISGATTGSVTEAGGTDNSTLGNEFASGILNATDVDNQSWFTSMSGKPSDRGLGSWSSFGAGSWQYTLDNNNATVQALKAGQSTTDTFTITTIDGTPQVITITIHGANDAPVANNDSYTVVTGQTLTIAAPGLLSNDTDVDGETPGSAAVFALARHGHLHPNDDGSFEYTPFDGYTGTDSFTYRVYDDGLLESNAADVTITVTPPPNAAPKNTGLAPFVMQEDGSHRFTDLSVSDDSPSVTTTVSVDHGTLRAPGTPPTVNGAGTATLKISGPVADVNFYLSTVTYVPTSDYNGTDTLTMSTTDGSLTSTTDTATITITSVQDAVDDSAAVRAGQGVLIDVLHNDTFINPDHTITAINGESPDHLINVPHGQVLRVPSGMLDFVDSDAYYSGTTTFTYTVTSGGVTETATVTVTLTGIGA